MKLSKKICAGFDGIKHEAYIYKNINGKKYCKSCTFKLQPPKTIKKRSEKQGFKMILKHKLLEEDREFYLDVWYSKFGRVDNTGHLNHLGLDNTMIYPICQICKKRLFLEPNFIYFHHILEKRRFPEYRHDKDNIAILCPDCHSNYESNPDNIPELKEIRDRLLIHHYLLKKLKS